jgi:small subunit ribosomal protein S4
MSESQFRLFFKRAERKKGITGETLLSMLERRLDNILFLVGFSHSRAHSRQLITHGHVRVNGRKVDVPSMLVGKEDIVSFREKTAQHDELSAVVDTNRNKEVPPWLEVDRDNKQVRIVSFPTREDIPIPVEEHLIVELYSK